MSLRDQIDPRGFTLVEVMIGITIFAIGILAVATLQLTSMKSNTKANRLTQASVLAQGKMEELMALDFDHADLRDRDLDGKGGQGLDDFGAAADFGPNPDQGRFRVYWNVAENHPEVEGVRTKTIRVLVRWQEQNRWKRTSLSYIMKK